MASDDTLILAAGTAAAPLDYTVPNAQEIEPLAVACQVDGTGAAAAFQPLLEILSDAGIVLAAVPIPLTYQIGDAGVVTWAPFLRGEAGVQLAEAVCFNAGPVAVPGAPLGTAGPGSTLTLPFTGFRRTDASVFATTTQAAFPTIRNLPGDDTLMVLKPGLVYVEGEATWVDPQPADWHQVTLFTSLVNTVTQASAFPNNGFVDAAVPDRAMQWSSRVLPISGVPDFAGWLAAKHYQVAAQQVAAISLTATFVGNGAAQTEAVVY